MTSALFAVNDTFALSILIGIVAGVVFGAISATIASGKGRDSGGWFAFGAAMGFLTGICLGWLPIVIVSALPDLRAQRARDERLERENRRLRERLTQEQARSESFRQHATARLDVHDEKLGVDTRSIEAAPGSTAAPRLDSDSRSPLPSQRGGALPEEDEEDLPRWHYDMNGQFMGPIKRSELIELFRRGSLSPSTLVWTEAWDKWVPAREVYFLQHLC